MFESMFEFGDRFKLTMPPKEIRVLLEDYVATLPSTELTVNIFRGTEDNAAMICLKGSMDQIMAFHQEAVVLWEQVKLMPVSPPVPKKEVLLLLREIVEGATDGEAVLREITHRIANQEISLEMGCLLGEALAMAMASDGERS